MHATKLALIAALGAANAFAASNLYQQRVTASDGAADDEFGSSVAVAGDTALVGAAYATVAGNEDQGAVYVFTRSDGGWVETQKLTASDGAASWHFGVSVAIDGDVALVGADNAIVDGVPHRGAAYVFVRSDGAWHEAQRLASIDGIEWETFGYAVALEGGTAFVGNHGANVGANNAQGAVYVFDESGGTWTQTQKLSASDGVANDRFGYSIALDGARALIGADNATIGERPGQGAAYFFDLVDDAWQQSGKLLAGDGAEFDAFGSSVALAGATALVGARGVSVGDDVFQGAAYAYSYSDSGWSETQKLVASDAGPAAWFGDALALDGDRALIGAYGTGADFSERGAAYVFDVAGNLWTESQRLAGDGARGAHVGSAVAFASHGEVVVAASGADDSQGVAYVVDLAALADTVFADGFDS